MLLSVINSISATIFDEFGSGYKIYIDEVKQGMTMPCFFITTESEVKSLHLGNVRKSKVDFNIQYYSSDESNEIEQQVFYRLSECLEVLDVDDIKLRSYKHRRDVTNGVLKFTFSIDLYYKKVNETELMNKLDVEDIYSE